jgi:hypothetical protein
MKRNLWKLAICAACVCAGGPLARAASLQRSDVIADPAWLLHLDCDSLRTATVGQYILSEMAKPEAAAKLAGFQTIFGFDLRTQLHGVTLYGSDGVPENGVMLVYADFDTDRLATLAKASEKYQSSTHKQHVISSWLDQNKPAVNGVKPRVYAAFQDKRIIFGQREAPVATALDVLDGAAPSMAASGAFPGLGVPASGHFVEAAARKMTLPDTAPNAAILKLSKSVLFSLGESQQQLRGAVTLVADSPEVAVQVNAIAQGLVALMKLDTNKPESVAIANALVITQNGAQVAGNLVLPAAQAVEIMKAGAARKAAQEAKD